VDDRIRQVISDFAKLPVGAGLIGEHTDLYQAGMTSHASVNVMLGLEECFDIEFPDDMLRKATFESVASIRAAISRLVDADELIR